MEAELYNEEPYALNINLDSRAFLRNTAKWGKFLAIVGFVLVGIMVLGGVSASTFMSAMSEGAGWGGGVFSGAFFGLFYIIFALLYFFPVLYLYKFSTKMEAALKLNNEEVVTESFKNLKSLFKFMGIVTVVFIAFYALMLIAVTVGGLIGSSL